MEYKFIKGITNSTIVVFHGTGGDIDDLIPIAQFINPDSNILSIRGEVVENGMNRYFKRFSNGSFDYADLKERTKNINDFILSKINEFELDKNNITAIGYSNGANIISSLLLNYSNLFNNALLFHPSEIKDKEIDLSLVNIFISYGDNDPICSLLGSLSLIEMYKSKNAKVTSFRTDRGHRLSNEELIKAKEWYENI